VNAYFSRVKGVIKTMANELPTSKLENQRLNTAEPAMPPTPVLTDSQYKISVDSKTPNIIEETIELQSDISRQDHLRIFDPPNPTNEMNTNAKDDSTKDMATNEISDVATKLEVPVEKKTRGRKKVSIVENKNPDTNVETNSDEKEGHKSQESASNNNGAETAALEKSQHGQEGTEGPDNDKDTNLPEKRARGRPKKEVSNDVIEKSASKTRGRPKKDKPATITASSNTNSEKRRGRPKREEIKTTSGDTANSIVKRGRGRPKQSESNRVTSVSQKRTRGRPKKERGRPPISTEKRRPGRPKVTNQDVFDGPTKTDEEDNKITSEKRGRGRPRKNPLLSQVGKSKIAPKRVTSDKISNGTPKPRGRPRKVVTDKEVDVSHSESVIVHTETSTVNEVQIEILAHNTNSIQAPNAIQDDPVEPSNAVALNEQETVKVSNGEPPKKRGRPKRDDQTEQGLTKKIKA
ncbi:23348_t:CDS:2, partial [Gigaspora margarita]